MIIKQTQFIISFSDYNQYLKFEELSAAEICVAGRSNVGKSSFINMLAGTSKLAKTSSLPGRTRLINLFDFNKGEFTLVDLPGYGYAKAAKTEKQKWGELIEGYLLNSKKLKQVLLLVDARHEPSEKDLQMAEFLYFYKLPYTVIATKADKISKTELSNNIQRIATGLRLGKDNIIGVSNTTGFGKDKVLSRIEEVIVQ